MISDVNLLLLLSNFVILNKTIKHGQERGWKQKGRNIEPPNVPSTAVGELCLWMLITLHF